MHLVSVSFQGSFLAEAFWTQLTLERDDFVVNTSLVLSYFGSCGKTLVTRGTRKWFYFQMNFVDVNVQILLPRELLLASVALKSFNLVVNDFDVTFK